LAVCAGLRQPNRLCREMANPVAQRDLPLSEGNFPQTVSQSGCSARVM
jgi:hypothetical protein